MITVELVTIAHLPPFTEVTLCTDQDGWQANEIVGSYQNDRWIFELTDPKYLAGFACKFALNRQIWSNGDNLQIPGIDGDRHTFYLNEFGFGQPTEPVIELGQTQTKLFDSTRPLPATNAPYDVIVIGSGMAGGILADQLSDRGLKTLVIEAGGVPLETHIANLPQSHIPGAFTKHVWQRWPQYQVINYDQPNDGSVNNYAGAQGFNLGGRSVFWGGFIPRMSSWELDFWPTPVKWDLEDRYYQLAEDLMGRSTAPVTYYTREVYRLLREQYPDYSHFDAPVAVRQNFTGANTITTGMFSTADLLLESARTNDAAGSTNLTIRTHHQVTQVVPGNPCRVMTQDLVAKQERVFTAKSVVFACGCLESARLAKRSGLGNGLVGQGVTDHPIAFTHFYIPPTSAYYDRFGSVKVVSQPTEPHPGEDRQRDPFNVLLELGADFNQGRYVDEDIFRRNLEERQENNGMLCEIVFLTNTELVLDNQLDFDPARNFRPIAKIRNPGLPANVRLRVQEITNNLLQQLGGVKLNEGFGDGGLGGVAHEVGSLRMQVTESNNIKKGMQVPLNGVVDANGKFLDQDNVYVCDLSIFPTSPAANPSLTAVALALRLSNHLFSQLQTN